MSRTLDLFPVSGRLRPIIGGPSWLRAYDESIPDQILELRDRGAIFFVNHSAGKDSQAQYAFIRRHVPDSQIRVIHAHLPDVEWPGVIEHIEQNIAPGHTLEMCQSARDLLQRVEERGMFPSPAMRWCTSDHKRGPLQKLIRHTGEKLIVNCTGMRAQESPKRSKLQAFKFNEKCSLAGREWYEWLPIHTWDVSEVFAMIEFVGQKPHWAYSKGMTRLSCAFCIMASQSDLTISAQHNTELYRRYVQLERSTGQVMMMPSKLSGRMTLEEITGISAGLDSTPAGHRIIPIRSAKVDEEVATFELEYC